MINESNIKSDLMIMVDLMIASYPMIDRESVIRRKRRSNGIDHKSVIRNDLKITSHQAIVSDLQAK